MGSFFDVRGYDKAYILRSIQRKEPEMAETTAEGVEAWFPERNVMNGDK